PDPRRAARPGCWNPERRRAAAARACPCSDAAAAATPVGRALARARAPARHRVLRGRRRTERARGPVGAGRRAEREHRARLFQPRLLMIVPVDWGGVAQQVVSGLSSGGIYAMLAVALVLIYRATGVVNFA